MGKLVQITCGSCGRIREGRIGSGILHGDLEIIAAEYEEDTAKKIQALVRKNPFALYDFSFSLARCKYCSEIVSVPVLNMKEGGKLFMGNCPLCGKGTEIIDDIEQMKCPACEAIKLKADIIGRWD